MHKHQWAIKKKKFYLSVTWREWLQMLLNNCTCPFTCHTGLLLKVTSAIFQQDESFLLGINNTAHGLYGLLLLYPVGKFADLASDAKGKIEWQTFYTSILPTRQHYHWSIWGRNFCKTYLNDFSAFWEKISTVIDFHKLFPIYIINIFYWFVFDLTPLLFEIVIDYI